MQSRSKEENNEIDNLFEIYDKVMHLNIFITSSDQDLKNKYLEAAKIHNQKIKYQSDYIDAGFDLFAPEDSPVSLQYRINFPTQYKVNHEIICSAKMNTSIAKSYNTGYLLYPRSSLSKTNFRLANSVGVIDSGYRGNILAVFDVNEGIKIDKYDRLVQICAPGLVPIIVTIVDSLEELGQDTMRGTGGFGSTGK
jgi:dUTPase